MVVEYLGTALGDPPLCHQGADVGAMAALLFLRFMNIACRTPAATPFYSLGVMWLDDTIVQLERNDARPF